MPRKNVVDVGGGDGLWFEELAGFAGWIAKEFDFSEASPCSRVEEAFTVAAAIADVSGGVGGAAVARSIDDDTAARISAQVELGAPAVEFGHGFGGGKSTEY